MAIVTYGSGEEGGSLERRTGIKAAKKAAKHPAKKHAAKHGAKHTAKHTAKHAEKHAAKGVLHDVDGDDAQGRAGEDLAKAFHHLQRAGSVISLQGQESGGDLRALFELGVEQYRKAAGAKAKKHIARAAQGVLRATEHLALAGLYSARKSHLVEVAVPETNGSKKELRKLRDRLERLDSAREGPTERVEAAAYKLLRRAEDASQDMHLGHELAKAVDGLCSALEHGM